MSISHVAAAYRRTPRSFRTAFNLLLVIIVFMLGVQATRATTITVTAGGNLQSAINSAQPGDTILLEAGASFMGPITLPNKAGAAFITIQSSALASLPAAGERVSPSHAALMPKILSPTNSSAILTDDAAHHYRFIGVEFAPAAGYVYNLINLGRDDFSALSQIPHHFEFDRCYVHAPGLNRARRGFALNASEVTVTGSYVSGFAGAQDETQAIACWNGPGPLHILNNYLEAGAEDILIGGSDPSIQGLVPSDIEIRGNYLTKQLSWRGQATIKTVLELKNAKRVFVTGNVIERGMDCSAMTITVRNQNGGAPWSTIEDVEVRSNVFRSAGSGINILGLDDVNPSVMMKRVQIVNNLFEDIDHVRWGSNGYFIQISRGQEVTIQHNTVFHSANMITAHGGPVASFTFRDNILGHNNYGVFGDGAGINLPGINVYFAGGIFTQNVIVDTRQTGVQPSNFPAGNYIAQSFNSVGFVAQSSGNYRLAASSPYKGVGSSGSDPGCDFNALDAAMSGSAGPTPTPSPTVSPSPTATPTPTPTATPTPTPINGTLVDDFNDNSFDPLKWVYNTIQGAIYTGPSAWDASVPVLERNQRLEISPRVNVAGDHYNGYVFANGWNLTNARATVEVVQTVTNSADTNLAVCLDSRNFYMISVENGQLRFEYVMGGVRSSLSVAYSSTQQRFWRIRHDLPTDSIIFETSANGQSWTMQRTVARQIAITAMRAEISAGTWQSVGAPGMAVFDNFRLESNAQTLTSPQMVANAQQLALQLGAMQNPDNAGILGLVSNITQAYTAFMNEYGRFSSASSSIDKNLRCALDSANAAQTAPRQLVRKRLLIAADYLGTAYSLMQASGARPGAEPPNVGSQRVSRKGR